MKLCLEKQVLTSLDKLSNQLDTSDPLISSSNTIRNNSTSASSSNMMDDEEDNISTLNQVDLDNNTDTDHLINLRGENKVIVCKKPGIKRKHSYAMKAIERKSKRTVNGGGDDNNKRTYRFHCKF